MSTPEHSAEIGSDAEAPSPITRGQLFALISRFRALGLDGPTWRPYRLAITSVLVRHPALSSTNDLSAGQAGYLLRVLRRCRDCRDLAAFVADHAVREHAGTRS